MAAAISLSQFSEQNPRYRALLARGGAQSPFPIQAVAAIVEDVQRHGDQALFDYMLKYDSVDYSKRSPRVSQDEIAEAERAADPQLLDVIERACQNLRRYHEQQLPREYALTQPDGGQLERRYFPLRSVGVCVPAAAAPLPSSLYMCVVPALVAGVERLAVISAPRSGRVHPLIIAVAARLGVKEIYGISGAQGVAALAFGTQSIPRVDKIVGPGNAWVATAKRMVYGAVGIDSLAGPSEVVIFADENANPGQVAIDLLAQAEHGSGHEAAVAFVSSNHLAQQIQQQVAEIAARYELEPVVQKALTNYGNIFVVSNWSQAVAACEAIAPEHVELLCAEAEQILPLLRHYGAAFIGPWTPEAVADYYAGCNHVLPTQGTARFSSGLTVHDFMRSSAVVRYDRSTLEQNCDAIAAIARCEGLRAHGLSVLMRCDKAPRSS